MKAKNRVLWVVEVKFFDGTSGWEATVGVALDRVDGRKRLEEWKERNPSDEFRLVPYGPKEPTP